GLGSIGEAPPSPRGAEPELSLPFVPSAGLQGSSRLSKVQPGMKTRRSEVWRKGIQTAILNRQSATLLLDNARRAKLQTLWRFLPAMVLKQLSTMSADDAFNMEPSTTRLHGAAVVMFDLCGFTALAENLQTGQIMLKANNSAGDTGEGKMGVSSPPGPQLDVRNKGSAIDKAAKLLRLQTSEEAQAGYGAEQLKNLLQSFFKNLISTITDHGGDVMRLAGDALIAVFADGNGVEGKTSPELLHRVAMVSMLALNRVNGKYIQGQQMHLHVALGNGPVDLYIVGSKAGGWQYVAAGDPFTDLDTALDDGSAGEVVASKAFWSVLQVMLVHARCLFLCPGKLAHFLSLPLSLSLSPPPHLLLCMEQEAQVWEGGTPGDDEVQHVCYDWKASELPSGNFMLTNNATEAQLLRALEIDADAVSSSSGSCNSNDYLKSLQHITNCISEKQDFLERVIRGFIPAPVLYECEAEESGWLAEIHKVAVIFVNIRMKEKPSLERMQRVFAVLQTAMFTFKGVIKEFSVDDKGTVMVGAFGLPPMTGALPAARACKAAIQVTSGLKRLHVMAYIGLSMGQVFTASIGSDRREFAVVGDVVNTAARLMSAGMKV
ncbi:unnamed protein product, partial [Chrysoparadoxa australica]